MAAAIPFAMKAAPYVAQGVGALLGKKLGGPSKLQQSAVTGTQNAANAIGQYAQPLVGMGTSLARSGRNVTGAGVSSLGQAGQYYSDILSNRRSARESLAPEMTTALDFYRGAEGKTKRTLTGGSRDYALAELDRQKVGQLAGMLPAARRMAAQGATDVGGQLVGAGSNLLGAGEGYAGLGTNAATSAAYINSGLFNQATQLRNQEGEAGKTIGNLLYDTAQLLPWGKGKLPSKPVSRSTGIYSTTLPNATPNGPNAAIPSGRVGGASGTVNRFPGIQAPQGRRLPGAIY